MQRLTKVIREFELPGGKVNPETLACGAWRHAVGKKIAAHTQPVKLVRTRLVVEVEDKVWQRQLMSLSGFILRNLARHLGAGLVEELQFKVVPRRREPARADRALTGLFADEAAGIEDPVLRTIYKAARAKAQA